jgi:tetratricopeptide (TPR) repeat protein
VNAEKAKLTLLLILLTMQTARANSAQTSVLNGNKLYRQSDFTEAIEQYDQALLDQPQVMEPKFNKANCYYQLDDLAKAIDLYNEVAAESKDMKLVVGAKYNLGNCYFQRGSKQTDSNLQKALEDLQSSIVYWRQALDIEPENENAAKNIEVARLIIKDIIDQLNKQKEQQQQQAEKQKHLQEKLKQLLDKQKSLAEQTQQTKKQANQDQIDQQQASDNYNKQAQEQSQLQEETEQTSQQMQQQDPKNPQPPQMQQAGDELKKAIEKQKEAVKNLTASDPNTAKQSEEKAAEHLENALKALSGENAQGQQQQEQQGQTQQQKQEPDESAKEQQQRQEQQQEQQAAVAPDTTAQEILDKEQRRKEQRQMLQRTPYKKVEKDW